jgi:hypothetical protein
MSTFMMTKLSLKPTIVITVISLMIWLLTLSFMVARFMTKKNISFRFDNLMHEIIGYHKSETGGVSVLKDKLKNLSGQVEYKRYLSIVNEIEDLYSSFIVSNSERNEILEKLATVINWAIAQWPIRYFSELSVRIANLRQDISAVIYQ